MTVDDTAISSTVATSTSNNDSNRRERYHLYYLALKV